jgi:hypothetical protein
MLLQSVGGGGQDFVDTIIAVKNVLERDERKLIL